MVELDARIVNRGGSIYILVPPAFVKHFDLRNKTDCIVRETKDGIRVGFEK